jgi:L-2,4-diaminobutyric acid acetyltransferase
MVEQNRVEDDVVIREPTVEDGLALHDLIRRLPPLSENSVYCNILQCGHFSETCAVVERKGEGGNELVGFVSGYIHPRQPDTYFLWQIGVHEHGRGRALGRRMIQHILARPRCRDITALEATASSNNAASHAMFDAVARAEGARLEVRGGYYRPDLFGPDNGVAEDLIRIESLTTPARAARG